MKNQKFLNRIIFSLRGLRSAWQSEKSFRSLLLSSLFFILVLIYLRPNFFWTGLLLFSMGATFAAELINTSLEYALDFLHPELHDQVGKAKDCAAAAVFVLSLSFIILFLLFTYQKFFP